MMKLALFSDVHGNLTALDAVLADIAAQDVDQILFGGDLCLAGARPAECLHRLREQRIAGVCGNTDAWLLEQEPPPPTLAELCAWTRDRLSAADRRWLAALPFSLTIAPTPRPRDRLQLVHANPVDLFQVLYPPEAVQAAQPDGLQQTDMQAAALLADVEAAILAFGHLHFPSVRPIKNLLLANISSVSLPADGDQRAKYALCQWDPAAGWQISHQLVGYDVAAEKAVLERLQPPGWEYLAESL